MPSVDKPQGHVFFLLFLEVLPPEGLRNESSSVLTISDVLLLVELRMGVGLIKLLDLELKEVLLGLESRELAGLFRGLDRMPEFGWFLAFAAGFIVGVKGGVLIAVYMISATSMQCT